ncbi:MAG: type II toxin-antitoxin system prevent-host-death family antitoxin [Blastochloris sp.]|nr:type II toxin-antitoxin system prevent-host-death family antitoxin [Blastochloris sp.]
MKIVNIQEAKTQLSRLIENVSQGETILIGRYGKPVAKLSAYAPLTEPRRLGGLEGKIQISASFDEVDPRIEALFR